MIEGTQATSILIAISFQFILTEHMEDPSCEGAGWQKLLQVKIRDRFTMDI